MKRKQTGSNLLSDILSLGREKAAGLTFNQIVALEDEATKLLNMLEGETINDAVKILEAHPPSAGVVAMLWFVAQKSMSKKRAKHAAVEKNSKPGGNYDKHNAIRSIWANGNYTSRDICAEQECAALDISFSSARKALRNTPDPT